MGAAPSKPTTADGVQTEIYSTDEKRQSALLSAPAPVSTDGSISLTNISTWEGQVSSDPKQNLARTILVHSNILSALQERSSLVATTHVFNTQLDFKTGPGNAIMFRLISSSHTDCRPSHQSEEQWQMLAVSARSVSGFMT